MKIIKMPLLVVALLMSSPLLAIDGHGNASRPEREFPETGSISGGPLHRNDHGADAKAAADDSLSGADGRQHKRGATKGRE